MSPSCIVPGLALLVIAGGHEAVAPRVLGLHGYRLLLLQQRAVGLVPALVEVHGAGGIGHGVMARGHAALVHHEPRGARGEVLRAAGHVLLGVLAVVVARPRYLERRLDAVLGLEGPHLGLTAWGRYLPERLGTAGAAGGGAGAHAAREGLLEVVLALLQLLERARVGVDALPEGLGKQGSCLLRRVEL